MAFLVQFIVLILFCLEAQAQVLDETNKSIGTFELENYLLNPPKAGISGTFLSPLLVNPELPVNECVPQIQNAEVDKKEENDKLKTEYEVIFVGEINSLEKAKWEEIGRFTSGGAGSDFDWARSISASNELNSTSVVSYAQNVWATGGSNSFDPFSTMGKQYISESLIRTSIAANLSEEVMAQKIAEAISGIYSTEEDRYQILAIIGDRLYDNYNDPRNPGFNNEKNNPDNATLPEGDMSMGELFTSVVNNNPFGGGVCNDISEQLAMIGSHLFPDKDVLTVTGGSHFGTVITDGKTTRLIDGADVATMHNKISLFEETPVSNVRISKVVDGKLKEIAIADTQMNQVVQSTFGTDKPLLMTDTPANLIVAQMKAVFENHKNKKRELMLGVGAGELSNSNVLVVVAKYEKKSEFSNSYVGVGGGFSRFNSSGMNDYQVHFAAGFNQSIFHYVNDRTRLNFTSGLHAEGMYSFTDSFGFAGGLDLSNRFTFSHKGEGPKGLKINGEAELRSSFGPRSWGDMTGTLSTLNSGNVVKAIGGLNLHLNQIVVGGTVIKPMTQNLGLKGQFNYQGSNIGQKLSVISGITVNAPKNVEILFFTGVDAGFKGYKTKNNLLAGPYGGTAGVRVTTKSGMNFQTSVKGVAPGAKPFVQATLFAPISTDRNRRKPILGR